MIGGKLDDENEYWSMKASQPSSQFSIVDQTCKTWLLIIDN